MVVLELSKYHINDREDWQKANVSKGMVIRKVDKTTHTDKWKVTTGEGVKEDPEEGRINMSEVQSKSSSTEEMILSSQFMSSSTFASPVFTEKPNHCRREGEELSQ